MPTERQAGAGSGPGPLGLLGGTFDPIHLGHLRLAEEAREALGLERVRLIPAGLPPHRGLPGSTADDRLAMTHLAVAGNPGLEVDDGEVRAAQKSYTVLTLERLRTELGGQRPLVLILGADAFQGLPSWHRWTELFELAHIAVANRPGYAPHGRRWPAVLSPELDAACRGRMTNDPAALRHQPAGRVVPFDMTPLAISASLIRDLLRGSHSARYLLPDTVLDYIDLHDLYR
ncbi:nicotinate-nucleotide adenylyltransferase [Thauera sinica]|uniref:Probable nicotinate-nucleotide adenylyltransferase n=1 Tax=Thauera sinica TaxID=2665146 RepID=A0ABW1AP96_9RHOO|nr:nicotinate-nucleotide adenylyltransferase [Thauera sp. K11]ATE62269.1 nicotinic acid mononucleotide adenylyltransferase [Thauera sp. K11]